MDPAETLRIAEALIHSGRKASGWRATADFRRAGDQLEEYREWRRRGGFEPKGGDARAERLSERLNDAWDRHDDEEARDRAVHADYFENPSNPSTRKLKNRLMR